MADKIRGVVDKSWALIKQKIDAQRIAVSSFNIDAPTWIALQIIGANLVGSWTPIFGAASYEVAYNTTPQSSGSTLFLPIINSNFNVPFNAGAASELIVNGGFESGDMTGWGTTSAPANVPPGFIAGVSVVDKNSGTYSNAPTSIFSDGTLFSKQVSIQGSTAYTASFWGKFVSRVTGDGTINGYLNFYDAAHVFISSSATTTDLVYGAAWAQKTLTGTTPNTAAFVSFVIAFNALSPLDRITAYIDDVSIIGFPGSLTPAHLFAVRGIDTGGNVSPYSSWLQPQVQTLDLTYGQHNHTTAATGGTIQHTDIQTVLFSFEDALIIGTGALRIYNKTGSTLTISQVFCSASTAPTTNAIIVDIHKSGTTIFTTQANRPTIAAAANTGNTTTIDVATWADGEYLTCDLDQVGIAGATGRNLVVEVVVQ